MLASQHHSADMDVQMYFYHITSVSSTFPFFLRFKFKTGDEMTLRDVLVNAGRKKIKIKSSFFIAKLYRNHIFMVSSTASFHSSHSPLNILNFPISPPSSFLPSFIPCFLPSILNSFLSGPLLSYRTDQWNVDRTKDVGLPDSLLGLVVFSPHVLHTFDCAHTHSLSLWSVFKIFVHMLLVFL